MRSRQALVGTILMASLLSGAFLFAGNGQAQAPRTPQIAFQTDRDGNSEIYAMDADGGNLRNLTRRPSSDRYPSWSPDGRHIAFLSNWVGGMGIYIMDADGGSVRRLAAPDVSWTSPPAWSPDGRKIAVSGWNGSNDEIYAIGTRPTLPGGRPSIDRLTRDPAADGHPSWSPDGRQIAFESNRWRNIWGLRVFGIDVMDAHGRDESAVRLTRDFPAHGPSWSPDGRQIAFSAFFGNDRLGICVMDADGANRRHVPGQWEHGTDPTWLADGPRIVFCTSKIDGNGEIYVVDLDGGNLRNLTNHPSDDSYPSCFDPASLTVSPVGRAATTWGWIKESGAGME